MVFQFPLQIIAYSTSYGPTSRLIGLLYFYFLFFIFYVTKNSVMHSVIPNWSNCLDDKFQPMGSTDHQLIPKCFVPKCFVASVPHWTTLNFVRTIHCIVPWTKAKSACLLVNGNHLYPEPPLSLSASARVRTTWNPGVFKDPTMPPPGRPTANVTPPHTARAAVKRRPRPPVHRTIITLDLDCFYASVAILARPHLRERPVAITQKNLCVTTNYVARQPAHGAVQKMTPVSEAMRRCPHLVLVDGSDLRPFRDASRQVVSATRAFFASRLTRTARLDPHDEPNSTDSPKVHEGHEVRHVAVPLQRHGLDEVFLDVTQLVDTLVARCDAPWRFDGHVTGDAVDDTQRHAFMLASQLCEELRAHLAAKTGLAVSGGISSTKLLSKLAVNMHKPDAQTVLFPRHSAALVGALAPRMLMGFGSATERCLAQWATAHGESIATSGDVVRLFASNRLALTAVLSGVADAAKVLSLCCGDFDDAVVDAGDAPKSLSVEDSCKDCQTTERVRSIVHVLVQRICALLRDDWKIFARIPATLSVGYRFRSDDMRCSWRAGPMPTAVASVGAWEQGSSKAVDAERFLAKRMSTILANNAAVRDGATFDLTLIGVGVSNFSNVKGPSACEGQSFFGKSARHIEEPTPNASSTANPSANVSDSNLSKTAKCPICDKRLPANNAVMNAHIDQCIAVSSGIATGPGGRPGKQARTSMQTRRVDSYFSKR